MTDGIRASDGGSYVPLTLPLDRVGEFLATRRPDDPVRVEWRPIDSSDAIPKMNPPVFYAEAVRRFEEPGDSTWLHVDVPGVVGGHIGEFWHTSGETTVASHPSEPRAVGKFAVSLLQPNYSMSSLNPIGIVPMVEAYEFRGATSESEEIDNPRRSATRGTRH